MRVSPLLTQFGALPPVLLAASAIEIYHYPVRSREQFELKIRQGGAAYARNKDLPPAVGWHWRRWLALIERDGVKAALAEALPSSSMVLQELSDGSIVRDCSMVEPLRQVLSA